MEGVFNVCTLKEIADAFGSITVNAQTETFAPSKHGYTRWVTSLKKLTSH